MVDGGGICSLANYTIAYEETQSNRVSDFRDFVCSLFPKAILFDFYFTCFSSDFIQICIKMHGLSRSCISVKLANVQLLNDVCA